MALLGENLEGVPVKGYELARQLHDSDSNVKVVLLVEAPDRDSVVRAFRSGARGVFSRDSSLDALSKCVESVCNGQVWASSAELHHLLDALTAPPRLHLANASGIELLAPREQEVVHWVSEGLTNREIADRLGLSENTVKNYIFRIFDKLGISKRVELILYAGSQTSPARRVASSSDSDAASFFSDDTALLSWCKVAVERLAALHCFLGECYREGRGAPVDKVIALMWFMIAERVAPEILSRNRQARLELARELSAQEAARAESLALEWLREHKRPDRDLEAAM